MQPQQLNEQRNDRNDGACGAADLTADLMTEPEVVGELVGAVGEYMQNGAALIIDGVAAVFELTGELLSGL